MVLDWIELSDSYIHSFSRFVLSVQPAQASGLQLQKERTRQKQELAGIALSPIAETF